MKKFIIISTVLILLAVGIFGYSLYYYMSATGMINKPASTTETTAAPATASQTGSKNATEAPANDTAVAATGAGVFSENYEKAARYVDTLTKEQLAGQVILGVCADTTTAGEEINKYALAGYLFESDNFQSMSAEEVNQALKDVQSQAVIKPILAAREEGGSYTTISDLYSFSDHDFNAPRSVFASGGLQAVEKDELEKVEMLKAAGFNLNLAPVVDYCTDSSQLMYSRSVGDDLDTVAAYAEYAAKFAQAKGVSVALKHFPGYGTIPASAAYSTGAVEDDRAADEIRNTDYVPFKKGADAGAHFIMMSNVVVKNIDPTHTAALSPVLHQELREKVGFTGVVMTDLLDDTDYSDYADGKKPVVQAIIAGNDLVLVRDYATAYTDILAAVDSGEITEAQLREACTRVIAYKYTVGIMS